MDEHFACVGIDTVAAGGVSVAVTALMPTAAETVYPGGGSLFDWRDASGAGVTVTTVTVDNVVQCITPTFTAGRRLAAVPTSFAEGDHCRFCHPLAVDVLDEDGNVAHALALRLEDAALTRKRVVAGQTVTIAAALLAEQVRAWPDADDFHREQEARRGVVPLGSVVPTGLYGETPSAHAMVTGVVRVAEQRVNETTGSAFQWVVVAAGADELEVVLPASEDWPMVAAGQVVQALGLVVGRVVAGLGPEPRGFRVAFQETRAGRADAKRADARASMR